MRRLAGCWLGWRRDSADRLDILEVTAKPSVEGVIKRFLYTQLQKWVCPGPLECVHMLILFSVCVLAYVCICACVCVCVCVCMCTHVCVCAGASACAHRVQERMVAILF